MRPKHRSMRLRRARAKRSIGVGRSRPCRDEVTAVPLACSTAWRMRSASRPRPAISTLGKARSASLEAAVARRRAARRFDGKRQAEPVGDRAGLCRSAAARAPDTLTRSPLFAPADGRERWCYRPWPRCRVPPWPGPTPPAGHPTRPPRSSAGTGDRQKDHLLKRPCRSRQKTPVRAIQNIPSGIRRWPAGGRPERPPDPTANGAKNAHSSSLIRPRTTAALQKPALHHTPPQNGSDLVNAA